MEGGNPGEQEGVGFADNLTEEQAALKIAERIDLLRLATREEIEKIMPLMRKGTTGDFFLKLFAKTREMNEIAVQAAIDERNTEAKGGKWTTLLPGLRGNLNHILKTKTTNTGLKLKIRKSDRQWRWETEKVQETKKDELIGWNNRLNVRHKKIEEITSVTEDKNVKCLLQMLAHQTAGMRITEIEAIFEGTGINLNELIERINTETLAPHNSKIHIRNGIVIIGPIDPHWDSKFKEPIVVDRAKAIAQLIEKTKADMGLAETVITQVTEHSDATIREVAERATAALQETAQRISALQKQLVEMEKSLSSEKRQRLSAEKEAAQRISALQGQLVETKRELSYERKQRSLAEKKATSAENVRAEAVRASSRRTDLARVETERIQDSLEAQLRTTRRERDAAAARAKTAEAKLRTISATASVSPEELASAREEHAKQRAELTASLEASQKEASALRTQIKKLQSGQQ